MTINKSIELPTKPNEKLEVSDIFKIDSKMSVRGFKEKTEWVPEIDEGYIFDKETTLSILAGFNHNRRVMVQGFHGTGKSTHIAVSYTHLTLPTNREV